MTRLEQGTINQPNAVEEIFCKPFEELKCQKMDDDLAKVFIALCLNTAYETHKEIASTFPYGIIESRLSMYTYTLDDKTKTFLSFMTSSPGMLVMYMTYLQYQSKKLGKKHIDFEIFGTEIFPWGFPSESDLNELWDKQKVNTSPDNLVDHRTALESIL